MDEKKKRSLQQMLAVNGTGGASTEASVPTIEPYMYPPKRLLISIEKRKTWGDDEDGLDIFLDFRSAESKDTKRQKAGTKHVGLAALASASEKMGLKSE